MSKAAEKRKQCFEGDVVANLRKKVTRYDGKAMYNTAALLQDAANYIEDLQVRHAEELAAARHVNTGIAVCEVVPYVGTLGHLFGGRDMRFLIDPASIPIGANLYLKKDETAGGS